MISWLLALDPDLDFLGLFLERSMYQIPKHDTHVLETQYGRCGRLWAGER